MDRAVAPLQDADITTRMAYFGDVEKAINGLVVKPQARRLVNPATYFSALRAEATINTAAIINDYRKGIGFSGIASRMLNTDINRAINAVADVWYTILTGHAALMAVSTDQKREYCIDAIAYYIEAKNEGELDAAYKRLVEQGFSTPEVRTRIGDLFYNAGMMDRAIKEYEGVLADEPDRKEVRARVVKYYEKIGEEARKKGRLEIARDAFQKAADIDKLNAKVQTSLLETQQQISKREARLSAAKAAVETATLYQQKAEQLVRKRDFAGAVDMLEKARNLLSSVSSEFPVQRQKAQAGLQNITTRLTELRRELLGSASSLSGAGSSLRLRWYSDAYDKRFGYDVLTGLIRKEYGEEMSQVRNTLEKTDKARK